jgi:hypothetical protein
MVLSSTGRSIMGTIDVDFDDRFRFDDEFIMSKVGQPEFRFQIDVEGRPRAINHRSLFHDITFVKEGVLITSVDHPPTASERT